MKCPGFEQLIDYLDARLESGRAGVVAAHLAAGCDQCSKDRRWYEQVRSIAASDSAYEPPAWVLKRAIRAFDERPVQPKTSHFGRLVASLLFDSFARPSIAGVRSTETAHRQLLYEAGDYSIDVQVSWQDQARGGLCGQILRKGDIGFQSVSGVTLTLTRKGRSPLLSGVNDFGEFVLNDIPVGDYELEVVTSEGKICVTGLPVKLN